jgi:hypothetical protein
MNTLNLKTLQAVCGITTIIMLIVSFYVKYQLKNEAFYDLTRGIFSIFLALTFHFSMTNIKKTKPQKYKPFLHKLVVGIWALLGIIHIIDFFWKY